MAKKEEEKNGRYCYLNFPGLLRCRFLIRSGVCTHKLISCFTTSPFHLTPHAVSVCPLSPCLYPCLDHRISISSVTLNWLNKLIYVPIVLFIAVGPYRIFLLSLLFYYRCSCCCPASHRHSIDGRDNERLLLSTSLTRHTPLSIVTDKKQRQRTEERDCTVDG